MIKEYKLVENFDNVELSKKVNDLIKLGWQPLGSVQINDHSSRVQTMVLYENVYEKFINDESITHPC